MDRSPYSNRPMTRDQVVAYARANRRSGSGKKKAIAIVVAIVAVLLLAVGGYYIWFMSSLDNALNRNQDDEALTALEKRVDSDAFYMLILGSDERNEEHNAEVSQRTDVMILTRIDAKNHQVTMLSIPRDTRYELDDGTVVKMNELYNIGGVHKTIQGVSELTGVPISHYAMVYMSDCKEVVDALGGVDINVEFEINNNDPETEENVNIMPGYQHLDGKHAQAYAISRHDVELDQDAHRQDKIRKLVEAIIAEVFDRPAFEIPPLVVTMAQYVQTDLRSADIMRLALDFSSSSNSVTVYRASGPSDGGLDESVGLWLCYENPEGWKRVVSVMDAGGDPSTVQY